VTSSHSSDMTRNHNGRVLIVVANFGDEQLIIPKATVLGVADEITEELVDRINPKNHPKSDPVNDK